MKFLYVLEIRIETPFVSAFCICTRECRHRGCLLDSSIL